MAVTISRLSREYLYTFVKTPNDLSSSTAEVAFVDNPTDRPEEVDWEDAVLIANTVEGEAGFDIRVLIGPGGDVDLTPPSETAVDYQKWIRITDNPERPVRRAGLVTVQ